jgi:hypothetical protein
MASEAKIPFLTRELRGFLRELDQVKRQIRALTTHGLDPLAADLPRDPAAIRERLAAAIKGGAVRAQRDGYDARSPDFPQTQHLMARLADRALDGMEWWGRGQAPPLTDDFPRPSGVADDLLQQIEDLLGAEPVSSSLAEVYILALAAGLEPAPDDEERRRELATARELLFDKIAAHRPDLLLPSGDLLFPDAYRRSQSSLPAQYLPDLRPWIVALLLLAGGLLFASRRSYDNATQATGKTLDKPRSCEPSCR